jgi:uroporphyrin-3 C-methyltransferase
MTEPQKSTHAATETSVLTGPVPRRLAYDRIALVLAGIALLGIVILLALVWRESDQLATTRQELSRRLVDGETAQREAQAQAKQNREVLDALQAKVGALEARLAEMQSQQMALETMYQELSHVREDRLLAEIEQEIAIAAQQLQLAGNVEAALITLAGVEARLARNAQPQFLPLRKLIARDIERLKASPAADVAGIALKLDALLNSVATLPLAFEQRPAVAKPEKSGKPKKAESVQDVPAVPPVPEKEFPSVAPTFGDMLRAWGSELWHEVRQLVRIERIDRPDPGLLAPREVFFLRENLRLRLLSARLALLARDGLSFQSDIKQSDAWLTRYFDTQAPAVQEALATLNALKRLEVTRERSELTETLSALRNFKLTRGRGAQR